MGQDLRLYFLSLLIMLMLWSAPAKASYSTPCAPIAVPIQLGDGVPGVWADTKRDLFPEDVGDVLLHDTSDCGIEFYPGTYYDGANHLWTLSDTIDCSATADNFPNDPNADFRGGDTY